MKKYLKAFVVASSSLVLIFPMIGYFVAAHGFNPGSTYPLLGEGHFGLSILLGLFNMLYVAIHDKFLRKNVALRRLIYGLLMGIIFVTIGMFAADVPEMLQIDEKFRWSIYILAPIFYSLLWLLLMGPLNKLFDLEKL